jgi:hypothetical protein
MVVAACGPSSSGSGSSSGSVPSGPALAAITPAGAKPVSSVVWAANRDVISLDPMSNPGTFGYGKSVFAQAYDSSPVLTQNIAKARKQAGDPGKTITFGTTSQLAVVAGVMAAYLFSPWADQLGGTG